MSNFTTDSFEISLLAAVVRDEGVLRKTAGVVSAPGFSSVLCSDVFEAVCNYHTKYNRLPNREDVVHICVSGRNIDNVDKIRSFVDAVYDFDVNVPFVLDELNRYVRSKKLEVLFKDSFELAKSGEDIDTAKVVSDIFKIQTESLNDKHIFGVGIEESEYLIEKASHRRTVPTNLFFLNEILGGGLHSGELGVLLAPPNHGKSMGLLNFAVYAWLKKYNVLYITLEMLEYSILRRVMMLLAGALKMNVDSNVVRTLSERLQKRFMVLYRPVNSITVEYVYSIYHQAEAYGIKFDAIYVDYADLLKSSSVYKDKRFEFAHIFSSLKAQAQILDIPIWTATQTNRGGLKTETVDMSHASESIDKMFISDVVLSLCGKIQAEQVLKMFLTKHREGRSDVFIDAYVNKNMWIENSEQNQAVDLSNVNI